MARVLLVMPNTAYRAADFLAAAERAGVEVLMASDRCHVLDEVWDWPAGSLVVDFYDLPASVATIVAAARERPLSAIIATEGEVPALLATMAASALGLPPTNSVDSVAAARDKLRMRELCTAAGVPTPRFALIALDGENPLGFPCVVKPRFLSASRGVIRADDAAQFATARARVAALIAIPAVRALCPAAADTLLVEEFIAGPEVALEGMLTAGRLERLAIFDKPDPLDGPFFEETIYVTPSRHPAEVQDAIERVTQSAAAAIGLRDGPVHAELRLAADGPVIIEIAARSIGGLCSRVLRFGAGVALEDLIIAHALGQPTTARREVRAGGVMMLPIPRAGVLRAVAGVDAARAVPGVEDCVISAHLEQELVPLPEGAAYLGFIFARGETPLAVEQALRAAHARLDVVITPKLPVAA